MSDRLRGRPYIHYVMLLLLPVLLLRQIHIVGLGLFALTFRGASGCIFRLALGGAPPCRDDTALFVRARVWWGRGSSWLGGGGGAIHLCSVFVVAAVVVVVVVVIVCRRIVVP